jgi:hypothetical protein
MIKSLGALIASVLLLISTDSGLIQVLNSSSEIDFSNAFVILFQVSFMLLTKRN